MTKKNFATALLCLLLSISFVTISYAAEGPIFLRVRLILPRPPRSPAPITSATKLANSQYQVTCVSNNPFSNGTFIVDIYPSSDNELKEGYQLWFSLFDGELKKRGTGHVKKVK